MLPNYQARSIFVLKHTTSYLYVWTYVCHFFTLTLSYFCVSSFDPVPYFTKQNPLKLFTALNYFAAAVKTQKLTGVPFLFELVAVVS